MPIYAYRCNDCGYEFEKRQRMMDEPLRDCPKCEGEIRRVVNSVGVVFKGSGFYITDSRNGKSTALPSSSSGKSDGDSTDSGESSQSSSAKTDNAATSNPATTNQSAPKTSSNSAGTTAAA